MSHKELSSLGFQDLEEFKSYHHDLADMFVNRPGYISKFKNFSWIDYALHSGAPNKNILIKNKNGKELEAKLHISEVFLMEKFNDESGIYNIEIDFTSDINPVSSTPNLVLNDTLDIAPKTIFNEEDIHKESKKEDIEETLQEKTPVYNGFFSEDFNNDNGTGFDIQDLNDDNTEKKDGNNTKEDIEDTENRYKIEEYEPNIKLKIDFDADDTGMESSHIAIEDDIEIDDIIKNTDEIDENFFTDDESREKQAYTLQSKPVIKEEIEEIDLTQVAEDSGVGLEDLARFINDFIKESKEVLAFIKTSQNINNSDLIKNKIIILKGIATHLKIHSLVKTLEQVRASVDSDDFTNKLILFEAQIKDLEEKLF